MKTSMVVAGALAGVALSIASTASADVSTVIEVPGSFTFVGLQSVLFETGPLYGELTGVNVTFDFSGAQGASWVSDFVLGVDDIAWGGFNSTFGLISQGDWAGFPGTGGNGNYTGKGFVIGNAIAYNGESATLLLGNGWTSLTGGFTIANVTITLKGVKIPAPGAFALLGLAGLAGTRRRRA